MNRQCTCLLPLDVGMICFAHTVPICESTPVRASIDMLCISRSAQKKFWRLGPLKRQPQLLAKSWLCSPHWQLISWIQTWSALVLCNVNSADLCNPFFESHLTNLTVKLCRSAAILTPTKIVLTIVIKQACPKVVSTRRVEHRQLLLVFLALGKTSRDKLCLLCNPCYPQVAWCKRLPTVMFWSKSYN